MKRKLIIVALLMAATPIIADAQHAKGAGHHYSNEMHYGTPSWGQAHNYMNDRYVYFPDYFTFYSPTRGYIYANDKYGWSASHAVPASMRGADMSKVRVQLLDVPLKAYPEKKFESYYMHYPAQPVNGVMTPVPHVH